jgi:hypothetical protein
VKARFPPILSTASIRGDDLLIIAGVLDRYDELRRLIDQPIATSRGATTTITAAAPGSLTLIVSAAFLSANERARARTVINKLIELVPTARISVTMRASYGAFAEFVRNLHQ